MRSASGQVLLHWLPISRVVPGAGPSHRVARVVFSEELSNTPVAHKLQYLKGGIAAWLHEAGTGMRRLSLAFGRIVKSRATRRRGAHMSNPASYLSRAQAGAAPFEWEDVGNRSSPRPALSAGALLDVGAHSILPNTRRVHATENSSVLLEPLHFNDSKELVGWTCHVQKVPK